MLFNVFFLGIEFLKQTTIGEIMKKLLLGLSALFLLVGCETLDGNLDVRESIKLKNDDGKTITLSPEFIENVSIKVKSKKKLELELKGHKFKFAVPKNSIPSKDGEFTLKSAQIGQPYDIHGAVDTIVTRSGSRYERETCTYQRPVTVCRPVPNGGQVCHTEFQTFYGWRDVRFHVVTFDKSVAIDFFAPNSEDLKAVFNGGNISHQRVYEYQGHCF